MDNRELIESLPDALTYEISKPSADPDLQQKVLNGDIKSHKEYKELQAKLRRQEAEALKQKEVQENLQNQLKEKEGQLTSKNTMIQNLIKKQEEIKTEIREVPVDNPVLTEKLRQLDEDLARKKEEERKLKREMAELRLEAGKTREIEDKERYLRELD